MSKAFLIILLPCLLQEWCSGRNEEGSMLVQLNDCTCLGYTQTFECTVFGGGITIWHGTAFSDCQRNEIQLRHSEYTTSQATGQCNGGEIVAESVGVSENCYISRLNVSIGLEIINETIECAHSDTEHVTTSIGQRILNLTQATYPPPSNVHVEAIKRNRIVFAWNETTSPQCSSIQYIISAIECGDCPNTTTDTNITCVHFSVSNRTCMFAVRTEICGYLVGPKSEHVIVNLFVPRPPKFKLRLHYSAQYTAIETVLNMTVHNMAISNDIDGSPISYNITYTDVTSGRICGTFSIPAAACQDGVCRHMSQITFPCSPSDDISLSVLSTNILGSGPPSQPVVFSLIADNNHNAITNSTAGGSEITCEPLVLRVVAILTPLLIITIIFLVMIIVMFTVVTVKLSRDKINLKRAIKATPLEQNVRSSTVEKEKLQATSSADYEYVDGYNASDMNINENAAYSTITID